MASENFMASKKKIEHFIKSYCHEAEQFFKKESESSFNIIHNVINLFFNKIKEMGFSMDLDAYIEEEMSKKSKKCFDIAKKSVDSFKETNEKLQNITKNHAIEIENIAEATHEVDINSIKKRIDAFQYDLLNELTYANNVIRSLEKEIHELQKQSNIDPLTKLYNRKALEIDGRELLKYSKARNLNIAALMIDADNFKRINDRYGHVAGDKVLILLAKLFNSSIREYDKVYRFGGEEFLVLFNRAGIKDAKQVAERILNAVRNSKIIYKDQEIRITLSMGLTAHKKGDTLESLIERADAAVYQAKQEGKDRLVINYEY